MRRFSFAFAVGIAGLAFVGFAQQASGPYKVLKTAKVGGAGGFGPRRGPPPPGGNLKVVTDNLAPGWLRRNGVPYGSQTRVTEYYQTFQDPTGKQWFDVTTQVDDPQYLFAPFITSSDVRHEPDGAKWAPHPCKS